MFTFYWLYQKGDDWLAVFKTDDHFQKATDRESLVLALSSVKFLVSYGNYRNSDKFLAKILSAGKSNFLQEYLSLDLSQEAKNRTIEELGFYLRMNMKASSPEEFCRKRIAVLEKVFQEREEYFETKFEIVEEFKLPSRSVTKTRAGLAAEILQAKKRPKRPDILLFDYDSRLFLKELPQRLLDFYNGIKQKYMDTWRESLVQEKFKMTYLGLTHTFGVGGVHAAIDRYKGEGSFLLIDLNQFFPTVIRNNKFLSRAVQKPEAFEYLYQKKVSTGKKNYKVLINAVNGAMKNQYSDLFDPRMFYSVTINGQLMITHLLLVLKGCIEKLIQTNTDGILIKINPEVEPLIVDLLDMWCNHFEMSASITPIKRVWQRDVNNYIFQKEDGSYIRKGVYASPTYETNNLPIVTEGAFEVLTKEVKPQTVVVNRFKQGKIEDFYYVGKIQGDFERIEHKRFGRFEQLNNTVCGIATKNPQMGGVFQVKGDLHSKLPGSPNHFLPINQATMNAIDTSWYVEQIEKNIF